MAAPRGADAADPVQVTEHLQALLAEGDLDFSDAVRTRVYLTDLVDFEVVNAVYAGYFEEPCPARATVQVAGLPKGSRWSRGCGRPQ